MAIVYIVHNNNIYKYVPMCVGTVEILPAGGDPKVGHEFFLNVQLFLLILDYLSHE